MKKLSILGLFLIALISFNSCETDDDVVFVVNQGEFAFTNTFSAQYILTPIASQNLGERFTWNSPEVGVPTNISFQLQRSIIGDFTDAVTVGATAGNEIAITIGDLLVIAAQAGLDSDPETIAPNTGNVSFRVRSIVGDGGLETFSNTVALTLVLPEITDVAPAICDTDQLFLVGAGVKFAGWSWDTPQVVNCSGNGVYTGNVALTNNVDGDGNFRFFTVATDWASGINFPGYANAGYTIDSRFEDAQDGDNNFLFTGASGLYFITVDDINKTITLDNPTPTGTCDLDQLWAVGAGLPDAGWSWDTPIQFMCEGNGVYQGWVNLSPENDGNFRFFNVATDWDSGTNYPGFISQGFTIDPLFQDAMDGDNNFQFIGTAGQFFLIIDTINKTITLN